MFKIKLINLLVLEALILHIQIFMIISYQIILSAYYICQALCLVITCIVVFIKISKVTSIFPILQMIIRSTESTKLHRLRKWKQVLILQPKLINTHNTGLHLLVCTQGSRLRNFGFQTVKSSKISKIILHLFPHYLLHNRDTNNFCVSVLRLCSYYVVEDFQL